MDYRKEIENDLWFAAQVEQLRQMTPPHKVDVTDAVMQQLPAQPPASALRQPLRRKPMRVAGIAAACFAGIVAVNVIFSRNDVQAATPKHDEFTTRLSNVYEYCNNYADNDLVDKAAYYDNPVTELLF